MDEDKESSSLKRRNSIDNLQNQKQQKNDTNSSNIPEKIFICDNDDARTSNAFKQISTLSVNMVDPNTTIAKENVDLIEIGKTPENISSCVLDSRLDMNSSKLTENASNDNEMPSSSATALLANDDNDVGMVELENRIDVGNNVPAYSSTFTRRSARIRNRNYRRSNTEDDDDEASSPPIIPINFPAAPVSPPDPEENSESNSSSSSSSSSSDSAASSSINTDDAAGAEGDPPSPTRPFADTLLERQRVARFLAARTEEVPVLERLLRVRSRNSVEARWLRNISSALQLTLQRYPDARENDPEEDDEDEDDDVRPRLAYSDKDVEESVGVKPSYTWNSTYELMRREHGLSGDGRSSVCNVNGNIGFNKRFSSSLHTIERMSLSHVLKRHYGCVNCLNFHQYGELLASGSDDFRVMIWDWANKKLKYQYKTGHSQNIFQTKFLNTTGCLDIITSSRDGHVRRAIIPPDGRNIAPKKVYCHNGAVHKLALCPRSPYEVLSCCEQGDVLHKDLRTDDPAKRLIKVRTRGNAGDHVRLFSISHNPYKPEFCVGGLDKSLRVYDKRNYSKTVYEMCPKEIASVSNLHVTCAVYNHIGTEILASFGNNFIYLFDAKKYKQGEYLNRYRGHFNNKTVKGVNFFGPNSEYVISGSDCGNVFYWDKNTEAIVNYMPGDLTGVVNCLEPHPSCPILATSGLDNNVKIWTPKRSKYPPDMPKLHKRVKKNLMSTAEPDRRRNSYLFSLHVNDLDRNVDELRRLSREIDGNDLYSSSSRSSNESLLGYHSDNSTEEDADLSRFGNFPCNAQ